DPREPLGKSLRVIPAHIGYRGIIFARRLIGTSVGGNALVPLAHRDRKLADGKGFDFDLMNRLLGRVVVAAHCECARGERHHFRFAERLRSGRLCRRNYSDLWLGWRSSDLWLSRSSSDLRLSWSR